MRRWAIASFFPRNYRLTPAASKQLVAISTEILDLPEAQKRAVYKDCALDLLLLEEGWKDVVSSQDAIQLIKSFVTTQFIIEPALMKSEFIRDLAQSAELCLSSQSISETERLMNAIALSKDSSEHSARQNFVLTGNMLAVRVPSYDTNNTGQVDNLGKHLRWAVTLLGIKDPIVKILPDEKMGNSVLLPAKIERMFDSTIASLSLPQESGDKAEFKTGLKANLVELLAAIKLMRKYQGSMQNAPAPKGKKSLQTTTEDLRKSVNGRSGLNEHGMPAFTSILVKAVFNELTKPTFSRFPGRWINSLKTTNNTKTNAGIIYKLGYETTCCSAQKLLSVIRGTVESKDQATKDDPKGKASAQKTESKSKYTLKECTKDNTPDGINHREFRLGAMMLLPLINPKAKQSPKDQISIDPLVVRDRTITSFYKKNRDVVDAVNLAYATKKSLGHKNAKSTLGGYKSARGHAISLTANRKWQDSLGNEYTKLSEVPEHIRDFLLSFLNRKLVEGDDEDSGSESETDTKAPATKAGSSKTE